MLIVAKTARISKLADVEDSQRGSRIVIEDDVMIDAFVKIKPTGGTGDLRIGAHSNINSGTVIYTGNGVDIGAHVAVAANCTFAPTNHQIRDRNRRIDEQGFMPSRGGIVVEDDVWIGANCVILDGAILRQGCVVGAGSLVRGELPPYSINIGAPAKTTGYRK